MTPPRRPRPRFAPRVQPRPRPAVVVTPPVKSYRPYKMRAPRFLWLVLLVMVVSFGGIIFLFLREEFATSKLQAAWSIDIDQKIKFQMEPGPNPLLRVPSKGPYNQRLGYSYIPFFVKYLEGDGYKVSSQIRASDEYQYLVSKGLYPIYQPKSVAGLSMMARDQHPLYEARFPAHVFSDFESIPHVLVDTLLYIENRELLKEGNPTRNPVVEWDRFLYAAFGRIAHMFAPNVNLGGGSTLATQIEKFRFSPGGQTAGIMDKMRQIISATLRVYQGGADTRAARQQIVLDYLNSTPLSARSGFGEINSIGDGLWAWFGRSIGDITLALNLPETDADSLRMKATAYREALGLILAQRRPTYYLLTNRAALDDLTDATLNRLAQADVISPTLRDATRAARFHFLPAPPAPVQVPFLDQKAATAMRTHLLSHLRLKNMYELDRIDLTATSTLDQGVQKNVVDFLKKMGDPEFLKSIGLYGFRLLNPTNDISKINWSVVLYEKGPDGNRLRVQADNIDAPFDMNEGVKLDLGSTAKLRTLVTYLEIVGELYRRYAGLAPDDLVDLTDEAPDVLTEWATTWLASNPKATLPEMLEAAMARKYSANPGETFFTGGGAHHFVNFEKSEDHQTMDLYAALKDSVNLVFIRLMRDIVNYTIGQGAQTKQEILGDAGNPARRAYLERYADREGTVFLNRFLTTYRDLSPTERLEEATRHTHKGATARTVLFRSIYPTASYASYVAYMRQHMTAAFDEDRLPKLYHDYPIDRFNLADRGYITGMHPIELWLLAYLEANPHASRNDIVAVSRPIRVQSYAWLFRPRKKGAQDTRIRILLELDAFGKIQKRWARLGYPFDKLVPSYATAIGSSADKPGALADLIGILLNDGVKKQTLRFEKFHFAAGTPFETILEPANDQAVQVLDPAIPQIVRKAMLGVIENGTARRLRGAYTDAQGNVLPVGGKTGTGDHRYDEFGAGGRLISSRVVNRTGTIVFYIGDKFFGTVTAHVAGENAANYKFTSALSAQMLRSLEPVLRPLIAPKPVEEPKPEATDADGGAPGQPAPEAVPAPAPVTPAVEKKKKTKPKAPPKEEPEANEGGSSEAYGDNTPPDSTELWNDILDKSDKP